MLKIEKIGQFAGKIGVTITQVTGTHDIYNLDPVTGETGIKRGVFFLNEEYLKTVMETPDKYKLLNTLSHDGDEFNRILTPDGSPYIDLFGMYVYMTTELVSTINRAKDADNRYDIRTPVPWSMEDELFRDQFNLPKRTSLDEAFALQHGL
jgi:hypothetical protein